MALVSTFNGGRMAGGGRVSSAFAADPNLAPFDRIKRVKFVVVLADVDRAAVFVYDAKPEGLLDTAYLRRVADETWRAYRQLSQRDPSSIADFYSSISDMVGNLIDKYSKYAPVVQFLK
ncbi:hypothetical protein ODS41_12735 [Pyrobaculum sp. 3827-6]|uniref:hypothetical protein n=1 Tax=Pyrobaculum sp. 3827-6 TaxID=2983604 RepID=UPI0021D9D5FA|nr:hypothetical protein [Pyrobaculum sp. 3827-6]MCU7788780.1 hypothetical protein [Pyrobaculum sp. 3827-6]